MRVPDPTSVAANKAARQHDQGIDGRRLLFAFVLILILAAVAGLVTSLVVNAIDPAWKATIDFTVLVVAEVYAAILVSLLLAFGGWTGVRERLAFRYTGWRDLRMSLGVLALTLGAASLIYLLLSPFIGPLPSVVLKIWRTSTDLPRLPAADVLALLLIVIRAPFLAPLTEELLFRGALYGWVRQRLAALPSILLITVIFTAVRTAFSLATVALTLPIDLLGNFTFTWVRERTGSTLNTFVMHATYETLRLVVALVFVSQHIR